MTSPKRHGSHAVHAVSDLAFHLLGFYRSLAPLGLMPCGTHGLGHAPPTARTTECQDLDCTSGVPPSGSAGSARAALASRPCASDPRLRPLLLRRLRAALAAGVRIGKAGLQVPIILAHRSRGSALLLVHCHPNAEPSRADEQLTQTLKAAAALGDVRVLDHLILAGGAVLSMAERGLL